MKRSAEHDAQAAWRMLGLAARAGRIATGVEMIRSRISRNQVYLIWLAADAGPTSKKRIRYLASQSQLPLIEQGSSAELGHWTGRSQCAAVALLDQQMAARVIELAAKDHV